ncbi:unnamed protein product [Strongylus vulgaris]|uniref:N-acetyltransferase domain-containing protein n=1 Tax=Strongylus vulgaris TaxID=40348 RepID=A0A3P7J8X7_STRVU|nr:unnamed protein product [Strongylus vulgaris]
MSETLRFDVASRKHAKDILQYLIEEFRKDEPISKSLGVTRNDIYDFFYDLARNGTHGKYSTVVYDESKLIGLSLCSLRMQNEGDPGDLPDVDTEHHDYAEKIRKGPYKQHKSNQLFTYVTTLELHQKRLLGIESKVFNVDVLGVHKDYRRQGLGKKLLRISIDKARSEGCQWIASCATACASANILASMGFEVLYEIPYSHFRENGEVVFRNLHDRCLAGKFMALRLRS